MKLVDLLANTRKAALVVWLTCLFVPSFNAQTAEPQRDQLLNGLRVLLWTRPGDQTVVLKLRIHSGAAFDTAGKAGTMALLGDLLFPDATTHDYFTSEMGGKLDVDTDYDTISITLQGRAAEYDRIVDILRGGLVTTPLTAENLIRVREARLKKLSETVANGEGMADQAIAARVLGSFPYTQPIGGTPETLRKVERSDVMLARDRFLSPNNATLTIIGGVDQRQAMRGLRQLLGGWRKNDQIVPATFRQPDLPDRRTLLVNAAGLQLSEVRLATGSVARSDRDFFAVRLLTILARERWRKLVPGPVAATVFARADGHVAPAMFAMGASVDGAVAQKTLAAGVTVLKSLISTPASPAELETAKGFSFALANQNTDTLATAWLEIDTFGLPPIAEQLRLSNSISAADLQRVAGRLFREHSIASVIVGNVDQLKGDFAADKIEIVSKPKPEKEKAADQSPAKKSDPASKAPPPTTTKPALKNSGAATKPD